MSELSMPDVTRRLASEFSDPEYRHGYADDFLNTSIAAQIKALRDQRGWTQAQLAERARMKPSRISAIEDVNYSSWSVRTLARLAEAFDVALTVCFKSFSERIMDIERFSPAALQVPSYADDLLVSFGVPVPPKLSSASPLSPLRSRLIDAFAEFVAEPTPDGVMKAQRYADQLMRLAQRIYRPTTKEYRGNAEWTTSILSAVLSIAQRFVLSEEQQEQAEARIREIDAEIARLKEENRRIRERAQEQIAAAQLATQQEIERIRGQSQQSVDTINQVVRAFTTGLAPIVEAIANERERIRQVATARRESDDEWLTRNLREIEEGLQSVEDRVESFVHA